MIDTLFDRKMKKSSDLIAEQKAYLSEQEKIFVREFMEKTEPETLSKIFDVIQKNGHPKEKKKAEELANKYLKGEDFEFDEIMSIDALYRSNLKAFANKDDKNE